jgi:hypothetical protein
MEGYVPLGLEHFGKGKAYLQFVVDDEDRKSHEVMIHYSAISQKSDAPESEPDLRETCSL